MPEQQLVQTNKLPGSAGLVFKGATLDVSLDCVALLEVVFSMHINK